MKKIIKRGHVCSMIVMAIFAGSLIGFSRYKELPHEISELFMAIGAMLILFSVLFIAFYLVYLLTSIVFGVIITIILKIWSGKKGDDID